MNDIKELIEILERRPTIEELLTYKDLKNDEVANVRR